MNKEIELKFEILDFPKIEQYEKLTVYKILQSYIYQDAYSAIRKRKVFNLNNKKIDYIYTVKTKGNIKDKNTVYEIETKIDERKYSEIQDKSNNSIEKYRVKVQIDNGLTAELDLYYGNLEGLITVEVEFNSECEMYHFIKPQWFGQELDKNTFSNANLSKMSREEFIKIIGIDVLNRNMIIKNKIEDILKKLKYL